LSLGDALEKVIERKVLFIILPERTSKHADFIGNAPHAPHITLPVITFALEDLRTHV